MIRGCKHTDRHKDRETERQKDRKTYVTVTHDSWL
jgi:hypothetical protein